MNSAQGLASPPPLIYQSDQFQLTYVLAPTELPQRKRSKRFWWILSISLALLVMLEFTGLHASAGTWILRITLAALLVFVVALARVIGLSMFGNRAFPTISNLQTGHNVTRFGRDGQIIEPTDTFRISDDIYFIFTALNKGNINAHAFVGLYTASGQQIAVPKDASQSLSCSGQANYPDIIHLANVQPGNYKLQVRGSPNDSVPTRPPDAEVAVKVIP